MTKRVIKIILILLAIFFILLGGMWLYGRHVATKNGVQTLSFKAFLGLGDSKYTNQNNQGSLSSIFNPDGQPSSNGLGGTSGTDNGFVNGGGTNGTSTVGTGNAGGTDNIGGPGNVQVSQFTGGTQSPTDTTTFNGTGNVGSGSGLGTDTTAGAGTGIGNGTTIDTGLGGTNTTGSTSGGSTVIDAGLGSVGCSSADTNITFTPDEIQKLNALQAQYNAIAANLASTSDVSTEQSNYTSYKLLESKVSELQNFCQTATPLLTDPALKRHVPTPFWHNTAQDSNTYSPGVVNTTVTESDPIGGQSFLERLLRINLW